MKGFWYSWGAFECIRDVGLRGAAAAGGSQTSRFRRIKNIVGRRDGRHVRENPNAATGRSDRHLSAVAEVQDAAGTTTTVKMVPRCRSSACWRDYDLDQLRPQIRHSVV